MPDTRILGVVPGTFDSSLTAQVSSSIADKQYSGHDVSRVAMWRRASLLDSMCLEDEISNKITCSSRDFSNLPQSTFK